VSAALQFLGADYAVDDAALARIPAHGRLLVIANHPSGALDALALLDAIGKVRRDVRIVANDMLSALDNLDGLLLPVRILGGRPAPDSLRAVDAALARGECVVVFPAGEVSRLGPRCSRGVGDGSACWSGSQGICLSARVTSLCCEVCVVNSMRCATTLTPTLSRQRERENSIKMRLPSRSILGWCATASQACACSARPATANRSASAHWRSTHRCCARSAACAN
jgi:hypothetical protein